MEARGMNGTSGADKVSHPYLALTLLCLTYICNSADRQIMAVLAEPIRLELGLSDTQLGLLSGFVFAIFYTLFGIPIAWLADRSHRVRVVAVACALWSCFTAASGLATNFVQLALARMGVAIGEAGGTPPSCALIGDYFPEKSRGRALAIYSIGLPIGMSLGILVAGHIAASHGWRAAFFLFAIPGLVLSLLLLVFLREPRRGRLDPEFQAAASGATSLSAAARTFFRSPLLVLTTVAGALSALSSYAVMTWMPAFLIRTGSLSLTDIANYYSFASGGAMMVGMLVSGWLVDRLRQRSARYNAVIPALAFLIAWPFILAAIWWGQGWTTIALMVVPFICITMWLPPALATLQTAVPPNQRGMATAIFLFIAGIVGNGGGPSLVGWLSDLMAGTGSTHALHWALTLLVPVFLAASLAHAMTARAISRAERAARPQA